MNAQNTNPKILLVDDDKDMCESLADVISIDTDFEVEFMTDPTKVVSLLDKTDFDLAIIDYKMPQMNGIQLLKAIKTSHPETLVFMLTAFISNELIEQAKMEGADKVLSKFIWPDEILRHIREVL